MDKDATRIMMEMMERGDSPKEIKAFIEKEKQAAALAASSSSPSAVDPSATPDKKIDKTPVLKQISFKELLPWLSQYIEETGNSPVKIEHLAKRFETSNKGAEEIIKQLKTLKILSSVGIIDTMALDEKFETAGDETLDFFEDPDEPVPPLSKVMASDPTVKTPAVAPASPSSATPAAAPAIPDTTNTKLLVTNLFDFLIKKAREIKKKKDAGPLKDGEESLTSEDLKKEFKISKEASDFVIEGMNLAGLMVDNKLVEVDQINNIKVQLDGNVDILESLPKAPPVAAPAPASSPSATPTAAPTTAPATPAAAPTSPGANQEKNETLARMGASIKDLGDKIWANKFSRISSIVLLSLSVAFVGAKIVESKNETPDTKEKPVATAPASPQKNVSNKSLTTNPQNIINQEITNKNYENTEGWRKLSPEVQTKIKSLINSSSAEDYTIQFFNEIEILNTSGSIKPSERTKRELIKNISQYPNFLNSAYSGNDISIPECMIIAEDEITKKKENCYIRKNVAAMASDLRDVRSLFLGESRYEPFLPQQTIVDSYKSVKAGAVAVVNNLK